jgi:hypothetical protein
MHVVVIEHLTPELIRRPDFLEHPNGCTGIVSMAGTIYDIDRCASKMQRLLGDQAVERNERGVFLRLSNGQSIELLLPDVYVDTYGDIAGSPDPETPRLGAITLRVSKLENTAKLFTDKYVEFTQPDDDVIRVARNDTCGVTLQFVQSESA